MVLRENKTDVYWNTYIPGGDKSPITGINKFVHKTLFILQIFIRNVMNIFTSIYSANSVKWKIL